MTENDKELFEKIMSDKERYMVSIYNDEVYITDTQLDQKDRNSIQSFDSFGSELLFQILIQLGIDAYLV